MTSTANHPLISKGQKICVICEGFEEYAYMTRLNELNVWNPAYDVHLDNAEGNGNIFARYQDRFHSASYDLVLVFCDTEKRPYKQYNDIKSKINEFHDNPKAASKVIVYANPCTMQIILSHWAQVSLTTAAKKTNAPLIQQYTAIQNYKATSAQRKTLMGLITLANFQTMLLNIQNLPQDDTCKGSTNFETFANRLQNPDTSWIDEIKKVL